MESDFVSHRVGNRPQLTFDVGLPGARSTGVSINDNGHRAALISDQHLIKADHNGVETPFWKADLTRGGGLASYPVTSKGAVDLKHHEEDLVGRRGLSLAGKCSCGRKLHAHLLKGGAERPLLRSESAHLHRLER